MTTLTDTAARNAEYRYLGLLGVLKTAREKLDEVMEERRRGVVRAALATEAFEDYSWKFGRAYAAFTTLVNLAPRGYTVEGPEGLDMTVVTDDYNCVVVSADGGPVNRTWHKGSQGGDAVFYEVFDLAGRRAHGYIDSVSRQIVQSG